MHNGPKWSDTLFESNFNPINLNFNVFFLRVSYRHFTSKTVAKVVIITISIIHIYAFFNIWILQFLIETPDLWITFTYFLIQQGLKCLQKREHFQSVELSNSRFLQKNSVKHLVTWEISCPKSYLRGLESSQQKSEVTMLVKNHTFTRCTKKLKRSTKRLNCLLILRHKAI